MERREDDRERVVSGAAHAKASAVQRMGQTHKMKVMEEGKGGGGHSGPDSGPSLDAQRLCTLGELLWVSRGLAVHFLLRLDPLA